MPYCICKYEIDEECTFEDFDENEEIDDCEKCPHFVEFDPYEEYCLDQYLRLRHDEMVNAPLEELEK